MRPLALPIALRLTFAQSAYMLNFNYGSEAVNRATEAWPSSRPTHNAVWGLPMSQHPGGPLLPPPIAEVPSPMPRMAGDCALDRADLGILFALQRLALDYFLDNQAANGLVLDRQANHGPCRCARPVQHRRDRHGLRRPGPGVGAALPAAGAPPGGPARGRRACAPPWTTYRTTTASSRTLSIPPRGPSTAWTASAP